MLQATRVPPRDECSASPTFGAFYRHLKDVVARRDAKALIALIPAKDANMDFGGSDRTEFVKSWKLNLGARSELWKPLLDTLKLGCARDGKGFISPYMFNHTPSADPTSDVGDDNVVVGRAILLSRPNQRASIVTKLEWDVVHNDAHRTAPTGWLAVTDDNHHRGYLRADSFRGGFDYRATFTKINGHWAFTFFGNGD